MISSFDAAASGFRVATARMATIASNIANVRTPGYRSEVPVVTAGPAGGAAVTAVARRDGPPPTAFDPGSPFADGRGYVRFSNVDLAQEMPDLVDATASARLDLAVLARVQDTYQSVIDMVKGT